MSQRMPDDEWADLVSQVGLGRRGEQMLREAERARAAESEKDDRIKALADALAFAERRHAPGCLPAMCTCGADAALRIAGKLP